MMNKPSLNGTCHMPGCEGYGHRVKPRKGRLHVQRIRYHSSEDYTAMSRTCFPTKTREMQYGETHVTANKNVGHDITAALFFHLLIVARGK